MNRRNFFKFLGIGAATAAVVPKVVAETEHVPPLDISTMARVRFFEEPRDGYDYSIGVEMGDGTPQHPTVASVMRVGNGEEPCEQVAEYLSLDQGGKVASNIAYIVKKYGEKCKDPRGPLLVIEQVQAPGDTVQHMLKIMGFTRFFKTVRYTENKKSRTEKEGWYTTRFSFPILTDRLIHAVGKGDYKTRSNGLNAGLAKPEKERHWDAWVRAAAQSYIGVAQPLEKVKRNV